jgi:hypothetical protein
MIRYMGRAPTIILKALVTVASGFMLFYGIPVGAQSVTYWYGNPDGSPIPGRVGERFGVDVYVQVSGGVDVASVMMCLGTNNEYIDSLVSSTDGSYYYPFTEWDYAGFLIPSGSPPNPDGWSSQSFMGIAYLGGDTIPPWLNNETPILGVTMAVKAVNNPALIGRIVQAIGPGLNPLQGPSNAGDIIGDAIAVIEIHNQVMFGGGGYARGNVTDTLGFSITDVLVSDHSTSRTTLTDINGDYLLENLPPGSHRISFSNPAYDDFIADNVEIEPGDTTTLDVILVPRQPGEESNPEAIELVQNYPNPFNAGTNIQYRLLDRTYVVVEIFDVLGRKVETIDSGYGQSGNNIVWWNSRGKSSGIYFVRVRSATSSKSIRLALIR